MSRQLLLDFGSSSNASFDNFIVGANAELVAQLIALGAKLAAGASTIKERMFYLWGDTGCGRSHLLQALAACIAPRRARIIGPWSACAAFQFDPTVWLYTLDDCEALSPTQQTAALHLFNEINAQPPRALVATGSAPPLTLAVREDLRTRLGAALVFQVAQLDDAGKIQALIAAARARGFSLTVEVPAYLLAHFRRDMPSLMAILDALDRFSLETQRAVTLPLLRAMLNKSGATPLDQDSQNFPESQDFQDCAPLR